VMSICLGHNRIDASSNLPPAQRAGCSQ
jgi:hypothetical protein